MFLTKDQILKADDLGQREVDVPEWGGKVLMRALTGRERDEFEKMLFSEKGENVMANWTNLRARLVSLTIIDGDGKRVFNKNDIEELGKKSALVLDRLFAVAQDLSGLSKKDTEELVKN